MWFSGGCLSDGQAEMLFKKLQLATKMKRKKHNKQILVGGWTTNPSEKYATVKFYIISPNFRGENKQKIFELPPTNKSHPIESI